MISAASTCTESARSRHQKNRKSMFAKPSTAIKVRWSIACLLSGLSLDFQLENLLIVEPKKTKRIGFYLSISLVMSFHVKRVGLRAPIQRSPSRSNIWTNKKKRAVITWENITKSTSCEFRAIWLCDVTSWQSVMRRSPHRAGMIKSLGSKMLEAFWC